MKIRFATALFALALPLCAQGGDASASAENMFYKAYYLEKGARDFASAMTLYEQFLAAAPDHKLAKEAAKQQFALLDRTGKAKERDAFKAKYAALLGDAAVSTGRAAPEGDAPARPERGEGGEGRPQRGEGGGQGFGPGGARMDPAARMAELEKQLEKAKADKDEEAVKRIEAQIERAKAFAAGGGQGGPGQGRGQGRGGMFNSKKLTEMNEEELTQFKGGLERMETMMERMKENMPEEQSKAMETNLGDLKKALDANKLEDAQKALDKIRESFPRGGGRRGGGGGEGGPGAGQGGGAGGGAGAGAGGGGRRGGGGGGGGGN